MNATVERIVNLLFEDVVMTEETEAIRDEVMNNCQERYAALIADGYAEDDAIGAVVESLKGMDDMLREYPRVSDEADAFRKEAGPGRPDAPAIAWDRVRNLRISVKSADVEVFGTEDEPAIELEHDERTWLNARVEGDALVITQETAAAPGSDGSRPKGFRDVLSRILGGAVMIGLGSEGRVRLSLPEGLLRTAHIQTLSGSVRMDVACDTVELRSASGDIGVSMSGETSAADEVLSCRTMIAESISGDVDVTGLFRSVTLQSTSGDLDFSGAAESMAFSTVSGDSDIRVAGSRVKGSSVSGDVEVDMDCGETAEAELSTVSGDLTLRLPDHVDRACVKTSTRSGDVEYHSIGLYDDAPVKVRCSSVSGDISVGR